MGLFAKNKTKSITYDSTLQSPAIKASICTGEKVAGFKNIHTGEFTDVMLIRDGKDLETFRKMYGIDGEIETIY